MNPPDLIQILQEEIDALVVKRAAVGEDPELIAVIDQKIEKLRGKQAELGLVVPPTAPPRSEKPASTGSGNPIEALQKHQAEIVRLENLKARSTDDPEGLGLIQARLNALRAELPALEAAAAEAPAPEPEAEPEIPLPSPEQIQQAERLIQNSQLEKRRGNAQRAHQLLLEAQAAAPGSPLVLETLADALAESKRFNEAKDIYAQAIRASRGAKNTGLETKHAEMVLRSSSAGYGTSLNYSDSPFLTPDDSMARGGYAVLFNIVLPGLGHLVSGRTGAGLGFLGSWLACVIWLVISMQQNDGKLVGIAYVPLGLAVVIHLSAILTGKSPARPAGPIVKGDRPRPPVDLPFE